MLGFKLQAHTAMLAAKTGKAMVGKITFIAPKIGKTPPAIAAKIGKTPL